MQTWAIVLAAGSGTRFGAAKQFLELGGVRVIDRALRTAQLACDHVVLVLPADSVWDGDPVDAVVTGGASRAESVRAGLAAVPESAATVLVHDAARALATLELWTAVRDELRSEVDAVIPGLPVTDTIKRVDGIRVTGTVDRSDLIAVQTPQGFKVETLRAAHTSGGDATDDAAFIEAHGGSVRWVPGETTNIKLTHPDDVAIMEAVLARQGVSS
jgi:2-C-methyl-D-erythritol 4-phosphate cytidylyltransferase